MEGELKITGKDSLYISMSMILSKDEVPKLIDDFKKRLSEHIQENK